MRCRRLRCRTSMRCRRSRCRTSTRCRHRRSRRRGPGSTAVGIVRWRCFATRLPAGGEVLAVCADAPRRHSGLAARAGGFSLISYHALARDPRIGERFAQLVAIDPPAGAGAAGRTARQAAGLPIWRGASLSYALRSRCTSWSTVSVLRSWLFIGPAAAGKGDRRGARAPASRRRSARSLGTLAARLIKVLAELELVSLDRNLPALAIAGAAPTALERSPAYRVYAQRYEDGRRFLSSANHLPGG